MNSLNLLAIMISFFIGLVCGKNLSDKYWKIMFKVWTDEVYEQYKKLLKDNDIHKEDEN